MASVEDPVPPEGKQTGSDGHHQSEGLLPQQSRDTHTVVGFTSEAVRPHAPPTYEEAMDPSAAPPPSYESLFGRVKEVHKESSGTFDFLKNVFFLFLGTIGCTILVGLTTLIPLCMLIVGAIYLHDCPANKYIPIYLLVGGIFGMIKQILNLCERCRQNRSSCPEERAERTSALQHLIACFMLVWFICGSYWVYSMSKPNYSSKTAANYCHKTAYLFAFWQVTVVYIMTALTVCCFCMTGAGLVLFARRLDNSPQPDAS